MVIREKLLLITLSFLGVGLFILVSLITAIFQSISRGAELRHELKVLGNSVVVEALQRRKEAVRKREVSRACYNSKKTKQHCFNVDLLPLIDLNIPTEVSSW